MGNSRVKIPNKIRSKLQKEINSACPFCHIEDVGAFEIHHIDGNKTNNNPLNLIMLCPTCHTKIEKQDISFTDVVSLKNQLQIGLSNIEFVSAVIDSRICNWGVSDENHMAFFQNDDDKSEFPVINFTLINQSPKTSVLKTIKAKVKHLYTGISGIGPEPQVINPLIRYHMQLNYRKNPTILHLLHPIGIPSKAPFAFELELSAGGDLAEAYPINGSKVIWFSFLFSHDVTLNLPPIYFNCNSENEPTAIYTMT